MSYMALVVNRKAAAWAAGNNCQRHFAPSAVGASSAAYNSGDWR